MKELDEKIRQKANPSKAKDLQRFFKTGKGEYGEGDVFLGIIVPEQRKIAKEFKDISFNDIQELLNSEIHEKRMIGLFILIDKFKRGNEDIKKEIFDFYLDCAKRNRVNNWDLVDLSAHQIVGGYLIDNNENYNNSQALALRDKASRDKDILYKLANSLNLWEKRIAIIGTFEFIRQNKFEDSLRLAEILLKDSHDLIHKAVGWMLREIGKRNIGVLEDFLKKHYFRMPRTMLRYAIEKFPEEKRKRYLNGKI
jgi:3-methyladenine DNA glycosylase AlkD